MTLELFEFKVLAWTIHILEKTWRDELFKRKTDWGNLNKIGMIQ